MFSWEIKKVLEENSYYIGSNTYINIVLSSPQIVYMKYDPFNDTVEMGDNEMNFWKFRVRKDD